MIPIWLQHAAFPVFSLQLAEYRSDISAKIDQYISSPFRDI